MIPAESSIWCRPHRRSRGDNSPRARSVTVVSLRRVPGRIEADRSDRRSGQAARNGRQRQHCSHPSRGWPLLANPLVGNYTFAASHSSKLGPASVAPGPGSAAPSA
jgi:hypothetical protein